MAGKDYYRDLEVSRDATDDDLKKAYRKLALTSHPDRNPGDAGAEERFKAINEAYAVLSDPEKRAHYDQYGTVDNMGGAGYDFSGGFGDVFEDIFGDFFGGAFAGAGGGRRRGPRATRGADLRYVLEVTLEDAAFGSESTITIPRRQRCEPCEGSGARAGTSATPCETCGGRGQIHVQQGFFNISRTCHRCGGAGKVITDPCPDCHGEGRVRVDREVKVKIPAGIDEGTRLKMTGEGELGANGGPPGDLYIELSIRPHDVFARRGDDIYFDTAISFPKAALGGSIRVPTLDGDLETLKIPGGTQPGQAFRVRGKGAKRLRGGGRGDQIVRVTVAVPRKVSGRQRELLKEYTDLIGDDEILPEGESASIGDVIDDLKDSVKQFFGAKP